MKIFYTSLLLIIIQFPLIAQKNEGDIEYKRPAFKVSSQFGQLVKYKLQGAKEDTFQWQKRFAGILGLTAIYKTHTTVSGGFFGGYYNVLPEKEDPGFTGSNWTRAGTAVSHGYVNHSFGSGNNLAANLTFGRFVYKYNPNASNLGEYMFRSMSYPTVILSGGLLPVHYSASTVLDGLKFSLNTGPVSHDILFTSELTFNPFNDFSFTYIPRVSAGPFSFGMGLQLDKIISVNPDKTSPEVSKNSYVSAPQAVNYNWVNHLGDTLSSSGAITHVIGDDEYYKLEKQFYERLTKFEDSLLANPAYKAKYDRNEADTEIIQKRNDYASQAAYYAELENIGFSYKNNDSIPKNYFSFQSTKVMAMAALDFYPMLSGLNIFGERDLRLFAEVIVLGTKDYPVFYEDINQRMPMMFGSSIPMFSGLLKNSLGFSLLDYAEVQLEYFRNDYPVSTLGVGRGFAAPDAKFNQGEDLFGEFYTADLYTEDDWKFSVLLGKKVSEVLELRVLMARDHFISFNQDFFYGRGMEPQDILIKKDHWYWMADVSFGF